MLSIDPATETGNRLTARLREEDVVWLTTVSGAGVPQPSPVWFLWTDEGTVLVASQPDKPKTRNVEASGRVALHFNSTPHGGDVQILNGRAVIDAHGLSEGERAAYDAKYGEAIIGLGMTAESFHAEYSEIIRITPTRLRAY